ncbi:MAG TPA: hypothetical protein VFT84_00615, partial [Gemmatimonadales bacterium]|nr:hypothetical protein [Gemmatimonadales bacterium]
MLLLNLPVWLFLLVAPLSGVRVLRAQETPAAPRAVVQTAERAVSDDSVDVVRPRWEALLRRDSTDRVALLGLASLARLTYDFATAQRL